MKTTNKKISLYSGVFLLSLGFLLSGCSRYYYQPNSVNAPMLQEKDDLAVTFAGNWGNEGEDGEQASSNVLNFQAAYSPINYLGLMAGYTGFNYSVKENLDFDAGRVDAAAALFEVGVGGYYPLVRFHENMSLIGDAYLGYGGGKLDSDVSFNVNRFFFQPGISFRSDYVDLGFHGRFSSMGYTNMDAQGRPDSYLAEKGLQDIEGGRTLFFEPTLTLRGGYRFLKLQLQHVWSVPTQTIPWNHNSSLTTLGLFFSVDDIWWKKR